MDTLSPSILALSIAGQGVLTMVIPMVAFIGVLIWYFVALRRSYPR